MKIIASILVVILLALGGALWFVAGGSLNEFVKLQIETVGAQLTQEKVSVDIVDIRLVDGAGSIMGLTLPNPKGFSMPNAFTLGETTLDINVASLTKEPIILDAIVIKAPKAFVQLTKDGDSNIQQLIDIINKNTKNISSSSSTSKTDAADPKISVTKVILADTQLTVDLSALGNKVHQLTIPNIDLNNIGGEQGLPASQLGAEITKQALSQLWKQAKKEQEKVLKEKAKEKMKEKLAENTDKLKESADKLKEKAKKELGKLFGN